MNPWTKEGHSQRKPRPLTCEVTTGPELQLLIGAQWFLKSPKKPLQACGHVYVCVCMCVFCVFALRVHCALSCVYPCAHVAYVFMCALCVYYMWVVCACVYL